MGSGVQRFTRHRRPFAADSGQARPRSVLARAAGAVGAAGAASATHGHGRLRAAVRRAHHSRARQPLDQVRALARRTFGFAVRRDERLEVTLTVAAVVFEQRHTVHSIDGQLPISNFSSLPAAMTEARVYGESSLSALDSCAKAGSWKLGVDLNPRYDSPPRGRSLRAGRSCGGRFRRRSRRLHAAVWLWRTGARQPPRLRLRRYPPIRSRCWRGAASGRCAAAGRSP